MFLILLAMLSVFLTAFGKTPQVTVMIGQSEVLGKLPGHDQDVRFLPISRGWLWSTAENFTGANGVVPIQTVSYIDPTWVPGAPCPLGPDAMGQHSGVRPYFTLALDVLAPVCEYCNDHRTLITRAKGGQAASWLASQALPGAYADLQRLGEVPDALIIWQGSRDAQDTVMRDHYEWRLQNALNNWSSHYPGIPIGIVKILESPNPVYPYRVDIANIQRAVVAQRQAVGDPVYLIAIEPEYVTADGVHPSVGFGGGYEYAAGVIATQLLAMPITTVVVNNVAQQYPAASEGALNVPVLQLELSAGVFADASLTDLTLEIMSDDDTTAPGDDNLPYPEDRFTSCRLEQLGLPISSSALVIGASIQFENVELWIDTSSTTYIDVVCDLTSAPVMNGDNDVFTFMVTDVADMTFVDGSLLQPIPEFMPNGLPNTDSATQVEVLPISP